MTPQAQLGFSVILEGEFEAIQTQVTEALKEEGFGVLTEIDMQATLRKKLNVDLRRHTILGACNPTLAYKALTTTTDASLLLPCNVTLVEMADGQIQVSLVNPLIMMSVLPDEALQTIAQDAWARLKRVQMALEV